MVVSEVVECGNMFRLSMEKSIEGAEEVCRVDGTWIGLDIPTEMQCGGE